MTFYRTSPTSIRRRAGYNKMKLDYENVHSLLLTNGEVDIEKVLCLHLLESHKAKTESGPSKHHKMISFLTTEQSPLEKLIEKSKKRKQEEYMTGIENYFSSYVIDVKYDISFESETKGSHVLVKDAKLAQKVAVDDQVQNLIKSVISTLEKTNPEKIDQLFELAQDAEAIKEVIEKPHIREFLTNLSGQNMFLSFNTVNTEKQFQSFSAPLEMENSVGLERLVSHIRRNLTISPFQSTWKKLYKSEMKGVNEIQNLRKDLQKVTASLLGKEMSSRAPQKKIGKMFQKKNFIAQNKENAGKKSTAAGKKSKRNPTHSSKSGNKGSKRTHTSYIDFLSSSELKIDINSAFPKKQSKDSSKDKESTTTGAFGSTAGTVTSFLGTETLMLNCPELESFRRTELRTISRFLRDKLGNPTKKSLDDYEENRKNQLIDQTSSQSSTTSKHIKQTTCVACIEKWKNPLPPPKISKLKKIQLPVIGQISISDIKPENPNKLAMMIDKEKEKLKADKRKNSASPKINYWSSSRYKKAKKTANPTFKHTFGGVDLDVLDLAMVAQEIKQKETEKKLNKFLEGRI